MLKKYRALILILLLALCLRLYILLHYGDMWGDEMFSFTYSQKPWLDSFKFWVWETNPPLHMFFLKLWFYIFPANEFFARLPSLIFGLLGIAALYRVAKRLFDEKIAFAAALLFALSPYHVWLSATARGYTLFLLLAILSFDYFERVFLNVIPAKAGIHGRWIPGQARNDTFVYALITLALLYVHLTAVIALAAQLVILAATSRRAIASWFKINLIPGLLWLIWAAPSVYSKFNGQTANSAWFLHIAPNAINLLMPLQIMFTGIASAVFGVFVMVFFFVGMIWLMLSFRATRPGRGAEESLNAPSPRDSSTSLPAVAPVGMTTTIAIFILIFFPVIFSYALGLYDVKFVESAYPWIMVASGILLCAYIKKTGLIIILAVAVSLPGLQMLRLMLPFNDWSVLNRETSARLNPAKKQILVYSNYTDKAQLERYFKTGLPAIPYRDSRLGDDFDYDVITKNYLRFIHEDEDIEKWIDKAELKKYDEIFVLQGDTLGIIDIAGALKRQGWKLKQPPTRVPLLGNYELYYFKK